MSFGQGVERIFLSDSKVIDKVEWAAFSAHVRRAKLFYLRALRGKAARLREVETDILVAPLLSLHTKSSRPTCLFERRGRHSGFGRTNVRAVVDGARANGQ